MIQGRTSDTNDDVLLSKLAHTFSKHLLLGSKRNINSLLQKESLTIILHLFIYLDSCNQIM